MKVLVTGSAGFIGSAVCERLLLRGDEVVGVDNLNDYYDVSLKRDRNARNLADETFLDERGDISNKEHLDAIFAKHQPQRVINLAAQVGFRYSILNPQASVETNLVGFANVLESCQRHHVEHFVYASSSSVYGGNTKLPYAVGDNTDRPLSLYAATKRANELLAYAYSSLHKLPTTGLRFFTVYGPWGRPDMALSVFAKKILNGEPIEIYNHGEHRRDFTYIDDIAVGVLKVLDHIPHGNPQDATTTADVPHRIYNIGNGTPVPLLRYIELLEAKLGKEARKCFLPLQRGDMHETHADITGLAQDFGFRPQTPVEEGISRFVDWYVDYYGKR